MEVSPEGISCSGGEGMNPAPHRIDNLETEKIKIMDFFFVEIICLNIKGGAG